MTTPTIATSLAEKLTSLTFEACHTVHWPKSYRVQWQTYNGVQSAPITLFSPQSEHQKGRYNGKEQDFGISYVANSAKTALAETFYSVAPKLGGERFFEDRDLQDRELSVVWFDEPLILLDIRALLPILGMSAEKIEGDDVYEITQTLADTLYLKFANDCHGLVYSSRWSGDTMDCAAIWRLPVIAKSKQSALEDYTDDDIDTIDILTQQLYYIYTN
ncbi:MAG: RES family NAD+ phosphorylase [Psychrosphaera sp.]|nr:RES family NAD+ phosphorylase [Psychrosphaera sp.]